jgi:hypothetical protein
VKIKSRIQLCFDRLEVSVDGSSNSEAAPYWKSYNTTSKTNGERALAKILYYSKKEKMTAKKRACGDVSISRRNMARLRLLKL